MTDRNIADFAARCWTTCDESTSATPPPNAHSWTELGAEAPTPCEDGENR